MKISISMYSLHRVVMAEKWSPIDFIHFAKDLSIDGVELLDIYWNNKEKEISKVREALQEHNLVVSAYDVTNNFVKSSARERALEVDKVKDGIRVAKQLGAKVVRVFCGDLHGDLSYEDGQEWIVEGLKEACALAESEQIILAIENHGLLAGRSEQVEEIIKSVASPYVKSTFDTGNFLLVHEEPVNALERLKENVALVHVKDFREKLATDDVVGFQSIEGMAFIGVLPGEGKVDLEAIMSGLKKTGYDGWLSIEYEGLKDPKIASREAVLRLRNLLE